MQAGGVFRQIRDAKTDQGGCKIQHFGDAGRLFQIFLPQFLDESDNLLGKFRINIAASRRQNGQFRLPVRIVDIGV